ncbi:SSU ribosomal protein S17p [Sandaracinus amylolyticus]|uniref:Small ribosomal subunit protein uS17 n=2 Tax=Sandaracinus amylolyticus TaxID=927083 RepID=A0A0F6SHL1_9BACT|nr:SSU ribosomal protein S17p [Sandaracinus amylolyticus]
MSEMSDATQAKGPTPKNDEERGNKRHLVGRVISDTASAGRAKKTVTVEVVRRLRDPIYGKYIKRRKRYHAHDETEQFRTNDLIEIRESRPLSATKRWVAVRLVDRPEEV